MLTSKPAWLTGLGGGPAVFAGTGPFIVAIARILRLVIIGPRVRKGRTIELHCHVGGDTGVGKVEDNSVSVGCIGRVVRPGRIGARVSDRSVSVGETSIP